MQQGHQPLEVSLFALLYALHELILLSASQIVVITRSAVSAVVQRVCCWHILQVV